MINLGGKPLLEFPEIAYFAVFYLKPERGAKRAVMAIGEFVEIS